MFYDGYFLKVSFFFVVVFIVFGIYIVVGNVFVCCVYIIDLFKNLWILLFYYVVNLVFVDILVGVVVEFLNVFVYWMGSEFVLFVFYIFVVLLCVSFIFNIFVMMIDCYIVVS